MEDYIVQALCKYDLIGLDRIGADKNGVRIGIYWTRLSAGLLGQVAYYLPPTPNA